jgi:hypothetical protein
MDSRMAARRVLREMSITIPGAGGRLIARPDRCAMSRSSTYQNPGSKLSSRCTAVDIRGPPLALTSKSASTTTAATPASQEEKVRTRIQRRRRYRSRRGRTRPRPQRPRSTPGQDPAESASENFRYVITEHCDFRGQHHAISRDARPRPTHIDGTLAQPIESYRLADQVQRPGAVVGALTHVDMTLGVDAARLRASVARAGPV